MTHHPVPDGKDAALSPDSCPATNYGMRPRAEHVVRVQSARHSQSRNGKLPRLTRSFFDRRAQLSPSAPAAM